MNYRNTYLRYLSRRAAIKSGAYPLFHPKFTKKIMQYRNYYPVTSLPSTRTYYCDEGYGLQIYNSDRFGLRNSTDTVWDRLLFNKNIFLIGDSFVDGACVEDKYTLQYIIQTLSSFNVVNLAMAGNSPYEYMAILQNIIAPFLQKSKQKNIVVLAFYRNDNIVENQVDKNLLARSGPIIEFNSAGDGKPSPAYTHNLNEVIENSYGLTRESVLSNINQKIANLAGKQNRVILSLTLSAFRADIISLLKYIGQQNHPYMTLNSSSPTAQSIRLLASTCIDNCSPFILYIPNSEIWNPDINAFKYKKFIAKQARLEQIPFLDSSTIINASELSDYSPKGHHLSKVGYQNLASFLHREILNK